MNSLILMAAMSAGQCAGGQCAVEVSVEAVVVDCSGACDHDHSAGAACHAGGRFRPVANLVRAVRERQPVRSFFRDRRPLRRLFGRRCR